MKIKKKTIYVHRVKELPKVYIIALNIRKEHWDCLFKLGYLQPAKFKNVEKTYYIIDETIFETFYIFNRRYYNIVYQDYDKGFIFKEWVYPGNKYDFAIREFSFAPYIKREQEQKTKQNDLNGNKKQINGGEKV
ncbi:MAG: hypothetical protein ACTSYR_04930 [Candidatus Odinarchaeia archaeon]